MQIEILKRNVFTILLFVLICHVCAVAADTPMLERTVTISLTQERLDVALKKIADQGGFTFSYNAAIINSDRVVTINFSNTPIREILDELFDGKIDYKERRRYIILSKTKPKSSKKEQTISGYIIDDSTGERLNNVSIYDPVTLTSTVTNAYGYFQIKINSPSADLILNVNKLDYTDTIVVVHPARHRLLKIPIRIKSSKEKISVMADSIGQKLKRFWNSDVFAHETNMQNITDTIYRNTQVSIVPFVGTNHRLSGNVINNYSFNIYGGYSRGVRKFEIGGLFNIVKGNVNGGQLAGYFNGVYGKVTGLQLAGVVNANRDSVYGTQLAGAVNLNWNSVRKFSVAGLLNVTRHESKGVVLAGLGNFTLGKQQGVHLAGLINFTTQDSGPLQMAGLVNFTGGNAKGFQSAGLLNFTAHTIDGVQASGLLNYATHVKGVQLGVVNISDSIQGTPIGVFSFVLKGYHKMEISSDEIFYTNLAFRTGVRRFYNIFTAGIKPQNSKDNYWVVGYGFGTAPKLYKWLSLNVDLTANQVSKGRFTPALNMLNKLYVGFDAQIAKRTSITFGVTLNAYITDTTYAGYSQIFTDYNPHIISDQTYNTSNVNMKMWLGAKVGVRFF